jgi:cobalamin biosynthesis Mg chelatase CobN
MIVEMRHHAQRSGRFALLLVSVIALALACFPVLAHAEDSSGVQYSDSIPKPEGGNAPAHHQTPAKSSSTGENGGAPAPGGTTGSQGSGGSTERSGEGSSEKAGGVPATGGGTGQGNPGGSANHSNGSGLQPNAQAKGTTASQQSDDGGSSPLIPILIGILVLAAISLGVVWFRQRRQSGRRPASPPASQKAS